VRSSATEAMPPTEGAAERTKARNDLADEQPDL
jgi:hypothetical protein